MNGKAHGNPNKPASDAPETIPVGTVMLPDAISYNDGPDGFVQHQNIPLKAEGNYMRQYRQAGNPNWVDAPPTIYSEGDYTAGIDIVFPENAGWRIVYLGE